LLNPFIASTFDFLLLYFANNHDVSCRCLLTA